LLRNQLTSRRWRRGELREIAQAKALFNLRYLFQGILKLILTKLLVLNFFKLARRNIPCSRIKSSVAVTSSSAIFISPSVFVSRDGSPGLQPSKITPALRLDKLTSHSLRAEFMSESSC
jgi:hypothetical protein